MVKVGKIVHHVEMHWVKSRRKEEFDQFIHRVYRAKLKHDIQIAVELPMPKNVKLMDDQGKELKSLIHKKGNIVVPHLVMEFDNEAEAREFVLAVRNDPLKLCKAVVDLFSEQKLLEGYEPRHKPRVSIQPLIEANPQEEAQDKEMRT